MSLVQRVLARFLAPKDGVPVFGFGCGGTEPGQRLRTRFLGMAGDVPLFGSSTCEFPRIGRYLMRFVGMTAGDDVPLYGLGCCPEALSGSSGISGQSGSSGGPL